MPGDAASPGMRFPLAALVLAVTVPLPATADAGINCMRYLTDGDLVGFARCHTHFSVPPPPPVGSPPAAYVEWAFLVARGICVSNTVPPYVEVDPECGPKDGEDEGTYLVVLHPLP